MYIHLFTFIHTHSFTPIHSITSTHSPHHRHARPRVCPHTPQRDWRVRRRGDDVGVALSFPAADASFAQRCARNPFGGIGDFVPFLVGTDRSCSVDGSDKNTLIHKRMGKEVFVLYSLFGIFLKGGKECVRERKMKTHALRNKVTKHKT